MLILYEIKGNVFILQKRGDENTLHCGEQHQKHILCDFIL